MIGLVLLGISIYLYWSKKYYGSLLIFFLFVSTGFQIIPSELITAGLPIDKLYDFALLYIIAISWMQRRYINPILKSFPIFKWVLYLLFFVATSAVYSIIILDYSVTNVIQVLRPYIFFLSFVVFFSIPTEDLKKVFHTLIIITVFQCFLFVLQILIGKVILFSPFGGESAVGVIEGVGYTRFYNAPVYHKAALFYLLFVKSFNSRFKQVVSLGIIILTIVGPLHRSSIISMVVILSIYTLLRQGSAKRFLYIAAIGILSYIVSFVGIISDRIDEAFSDMQNTFSSNLSVQNIDITANTSLFRIGHFLERFNYIIISPERWFFGIGLISENAPYVSKLKFQYGLVSEATNQIVQIDTGDLIWSPLILTLGILGTIIYVLLFIKFMILFFKSIEVTKYGIIGFLVILSALIVSFTGTEMIGTHFRVIVIFLATIVCKQVYSSGKADVKPTLI